MAANDTIDFDREHLWHPYSSLSNPIAALHVESASGVRLRLKDGRELIDGMASWWSVIHGYNHPVLNAAIENQLRDVAHVMFGGLTHDPAIALGRQLVALAPPGLDRVFFSDSGSVAVDVAMKMALQYWQARQLPGKQQFIALRGGYHGDTLGAMSLCDPDTGMHHLFGSVLNRQHFLPRPRARFGEPADRRDLDALERCLEQHHGTIAALFVEPIVQGAGGMYFYSAEYLQHFRELCDRFNVLLVFDEIATGFGRTGPFFAAEHAGVSPDILCVGKALTGGYLTLAATLTREHIAMTICDGEAKAFMHGPTFMANPLACAVASASIQLLLDNDWQQDVQRIEGTLQAQLLPFNDHPLVDQARVLGAIGVIETHKPVDMNKVQALLPETGVWLRPFGKLVYTMPPYSCTADELQHIVDAMISVTEHCQS